MRRHRRKEEPIPGQKVEKRKKRRWDRKPEVSYGFSTMMGDYSIEIDWTVPHMTFRERKKRG